MISLGLSCGLTLNDWQYLTLGEVADVIIERNKMVNEALGTEEKTSKSRVRVATQDDWDRF